METKKTFKVQFDLCKKDDRLLLETLEKLLQGSDKQQTKSKLKVSDLLKLGASKVSKKDLDTLKRDLMSEREVLELWTRGYNFSNDKNFSLDEFAVKALPSLSPKELKKLEITQCN